MKYRYREDKELKSVDVEWLDSIPRECKVKRLKYLASIETGSRDTQDRILDGAYPFFVRSDTVERINTYSFDGEAILTAGDGAGVAKVFHYIKGKFDYHQRVYKISDFKEVNGKYLYYWIKENLKKEVEKLSAKTTVDSLRLPMFLNLPVLVYADEGEKIGEFLDEKTSQFDCIISKKENLIQKLEEAKKSLISEVVTGKVKVIQTNAGYQLIPRKENEMKDSGIEWIGTIPEEWDIKPLYTNFIENKVKNKNDQEKNVLSLSYGRIKKRDIESNMGLLPESFSNYQVVEDGDIIFRLTDLQNDKKSLRVGLVEEKGIITSAYTGLKVKSGISKYFYYLFHFYDIKKLYYNLGAGVRQSMSFSDLKKLPIIVMSLEEQVKIAEAIESKVSEMDQVIGMMKRHISKLKEAKQSLISEAVTGRIEILED